MAKKRRKSKRRPIAPPVHSAPGATHGPSGPGAAEPPPARPFTPEPPTTTESGPPRAATRTPSGARRRPATRRKRRRLGPWVYAIGAVVLIIAVIVGRQMLGNRSLNQFNALAKANGCSEIDETSGSGGMQHLAEGQRARYDTSPPTHGAHAPNALNAGVYERQFSSNPENEPTIYQAVHSLEHGYIIVWHHELSRSKQRDLENRYENERKVIVVPYGAMPEGSKMAMTAWGRMVTCKDAEPDVIDAFVDRFREARSAPEPRAP